MTTAFAYLRRQLYVLDTYPNAAVKRLNHTMLFLYSYASLGIFVPLFVIVFYVIQVSLYVTRALSPTTTGIADAFPRISTYALLRLAISYARALEEWQIDRCMPLYTHKSYAAPASSPTRVTDTHTHTHTHYCDCAFNDGTPSLYHPCAFVCTSLVSLSFYAQASLVSSLTFSRVWEVFSRFNS